MTVQQDRFTYDFNKDTPPAAECSAGDTVIFLTQDCFAGQVTGEEPASIDFSHTNPATGPLYVRGAEPGDALAVDILDIRVADRGVVCTLENIGVLWQPGGLRTRIIPVTDGTAEFNGLRWPVKPMIGVIGTAPAGDPVATGASFRCGGNMDSNVITAGTTVCLPVQVPGALLCIGDLHASMGDGEIAGTGIEIAGTVTVRVRLLKQADLNWPVTETPDAWFVNTNGFTADEAITAGYRELQRLIMRAWNWDAADTVLYLSMRAILSANQACLDVVEDPNEGPTFRVGIPKEQGAAPLL